MKKIIALLICFILLAGCQSNDAGSGSPAIDGTPDVDETAPVDTDGDADETDDDGLSDWDYILDKGTLIVGLDDTFAPMGFRDEGGNLVGFDIDLAEAVGAYLDIEVVFQPIDWDAKEMELSTKKIDCIWNGMSATPERQESMSLTRGYLNNRIIMMSVEGVDVTSKEDLKELTVATQAKSAALEMVQADDIYAEIEVDEYPTYDEIIMDMDAGRIQVMIVDEVLGMYKNSMRDGSFNVSSVDFGDDLYAVGFRKGDTEAVSKIEEAFDALIADGTAAEISEKWFGADIVVK